MVELGLFSHDVAYMGEPVTGWVESADQLNHREGSSMHCHANAALTPKRRAMVFEAVEAGMTVTAAPGSPGWPVPAGTSSSAGGLDGRAPPSTMTVMLHGVPAMEDVLRVLVIVVLASWAGWGFMVGLRAKEGRVNDMAGLSEASHGVGDDEGNGEVGSTPSVSGRPRPL